MHVYIVESSLFRVFNNVLNLSNLFNIKFDDNIVIICKFIL